MQLGGAPPGCGVFALRFLLSRQHRSNTHGAAGGGDGRRTGRTRKVAQRMAVVSDAERSQAATARLAALEDDDFAAVADAGADNSDDEFVVDGGSDDGAQLRVSARSLCCGRLPSSGCTKPAAHLVCCSVLHAKPSWSGGAQRPSQASPARASGARAAAGAPAAAAGAGPSARRARCWRPSGAGRARSPGCSRRPRPRRLSRGGRLRRRTWPLQLGRRCERMCTFAQPDCKQGGDRHLCLLMMTAPHGTQVGASPRRWCSVCGFAAPYRCVRCGSRFLHAQVLWRAHRDAVPEVCGVRDRPRVAESGAVLRGCAPSCVRPRVHVCARCLAWLPAGVVVVR